MREIVKEAESLLDKIAKSGENLTDEYEGLFFDLMSSVNDVGVICYLTDKVNRYEYAIDIYKNTISRIDVNTDDGVIFKLAVTEKERLYTKALSVISILAIKVPNSNGNSFLV